MSNRNRITNFFRNLDAQDGAGRRIVLRKLRRVGVVVLFTILASDRAWSGDSVMATIMSTKDVTLSERLAARVAERFSMNPGTKHILLISGGGPKGAYGTGFLQGWSERSTGTPDADSKPKEFDVVTGISVGALMATHAYLGGASMDALEDLMANTESRDVFHARPFFVFPFSTGISSHKRLKKYLEKHIPNELIEEVSHVAGTSKRCLFVGAVDLVTGQTIIFDLGTLAIEKKYDEYRQAVLASALMPVGYTVLRENPLVYTDGGVREIILIRDFMVGAAMTKSFSTQFQALNTTAASLNAEPYAKVWTLMNQSDSVPVQLSVGKWGGTGKLPLLNVILRDVELLSQASLIGSVNYAHFVSTQVSGVEFRYSSMPADIPVPSIRHFTKKDMRGLISAGKVEGKKNGAWKTTPPDYDGLITKLQAMEKARNAGAPSR